MRLVAYIYDIVVLTESQELTRNHVEGAVYLLTCLGFQVNHKKSILDPNQNTRISGSGNGQCIHGVEAHHRENEKDPF